MQDMSYAKFQIIYDGPALTDSLMDVRDLAPALLALGDSIEEANFALNRKKSSISLKVNASFQSGCFGIEFDVIQGTLDQALSLFTDNGISTAKEIVELLGFASSPFIGLLGLLRWLKGRKPDEIILIEHNQVKVICDNKTLVTEQKTIELYRHYKLRQALEKAVVEQLNKEGINSVAFKTAGKDDFITVSKSESQWFKATVDEENLGSDINTYTLQIITVSFKGDNKWRLSDGNNTFFATITDESFLKKVDHGEEKFASGDLLKVKLKKRQWLANGQIKAEQEIIKVMEHRGAHKQQDVFK